VAFFHLWYIKKPPDDVTAKISSHVAEYLRVNEEQPFCNGLLCFPLLTWFSELTATYWGRTTADPIAFVKRF
jgi:hypothetical protein